MNVVVSGYTAEMAHAAAARGAAWMDEHLPGWFDLIDFEKLDMRDPTCCILGQTGDKLVPEDFDVDLLPYSRVLAFVNATDGPVGTHKWSIDNGFEVAFCTAEYEMLAIAWTELIRERRAQAEVKALFTAPVEERELVLA